tara:strand:- start:393 stop:1007 length:615 start_codon:yes stop_codon:yes gene_type:complete
MPRKAPDKVIEHRITLGNYERETTRELVKRHKINSNAAIVTNSLQSISLPLLGAAALLYVGFSLDDVVESAKSTFDKYTNKISDWLVNPDGAGVVNYTADEIGRAIIKTEEEKAAVMDEYMAFFNSPEFALNGGMQGARATAYRRKLESLESRERILRKMLNDIAEGGGISYLIGGSDEAQKENLQEYYEREGGEGQINWELGN